LAHYDESESISADFLEGRDVISEFRGFLLKTNALALAIGVIIGGALGNAIDWYSFAISATVGVVLAVVGMLYFRRVERTFADLI